MKRLISILTVATFFLSGCQSTYIDQPAVKVNTPTLESKIEQLETLVEQNGDDSRKFYLATLYTQSLNQAVRKKAKTLLVELADKNYKETGVYLSLHETMGSLGYVSDQGYHKYKGSFTADNLELFSSNFDKSSKLLSYFGKNIETFDRIYQANYQQCAQPLEGQLQSIEATPLGYMHWSYINRCLEHYSHNNTESRFEALANYAQISCDYDTELKVCTADGYRGIDNADLRPENAAAIAFALREVVKDYDRFLKPSTGNSERMYSNVIAQKSSAFFKAMEKDNYDQAISIMKPLLSDPNLSKFDVATLNRYIGAMYSNRGQDGDWLTGLDYLSKALNAKQLDTDDQYVTQKAIFNLYLLTEQYERYIKEVTAYIAMHQKQLTLLPKAFFKAVEQYKTTPSKVVKSTI